MELSAAALMVLLKLLLLLEQLRASALQLVALLGKLRLFPSDLLTLLIQLSARLRITAPCFVELLIMVALGRAKALTLTFDVGKDSQHLIARGRRRVAGGNLRRARIIRSGAALVEMRGAAVARFRAVVGVHCDALPRRHRRAA